jgi:hypothetical protein
MESELWLWEMAVRFKHDLKNGFVIWYQQTEKKEGKDSLWKIYAFFFESSVREETALEKYIYIYKVCTDLCLYPKRQQKCREEAGELPR